MMTPAEPAPSSSLVAFSRISSPPAEASAAVSGSRGDPALTAAAVGDGSHFLESCVAFDLTGPAAVCFRPFARGASAHCRYQSVVPDVRNASFGYRTPISHPFTSWRLLTRTFVQAGARTLNYGLQWEAEHSVTTQRGCSVQSKVAATFGRHSFAVVSCHLTQLLMGAMTRVGGGVSHALTRDLSSPQVFLGVRRDVYTSWSVGLDARWILNPHTTLSSLASGLTPDLSMSLCSVSVADGDGSGRSKRSHDTPSLRASLSLGRAREFPLDTVVSLIAEVPLAAGAGYSAGQHPRRSRLKRQENPSSVRFFAHTELVPAVEWITTASAGVMSCVHETVAGPYFVGVGLCAYESGLGTVLRFQGPAFCFNVPLSWTEETPARSVILALLVPLAFSPILRWLTSRSEAQLTKQRTVQRRHRIARYRKARSEARVHQRAMKDNAIECARKEADRHGLVIQEAMYGLCGCDGAGDGENADRQHPHDAGPGGGSAPAGTSLDFWPVVDVTVPLQFMVEESSLRLPAGRKCELLGFYDPLEDPRFLERLCSSDGVCSLRECIHDSELMLLVRYSYGGHTSIALFHDTDEVVLPLPSKAVVRS